MKKILKKLFDWRKNLSAGYGSSEQRITLYLKNGRRPWSEGYADYKWRCIGAAINSDEVLKSFSNNIIGDEYGLGIDERIVEYPWIISHLSERSGHLLDAGSTFNFDVILEQKRIREKNITIYTFHPESNNYTERGITYAYGDIRKMPFDDECFDEVVCQSTIEHIDMDNSIYGYDSTNNSAKKSKSYEYLVAIDELLRVLSKEGTMLITFPYGKFESHGYFQQFDSEMLDKVIERMVAFGNCEFTFFKYTTRGWRIASRDQCDLLECYNPHTGVGKGNDGAAHSRGICSIKFVKR